jgi:hypothetical protein
MKRTKPRKNGKAESSSTGILLIGVVVDAIVVGAILVTVLGGENVSADSPFHWVGGTDSQETGEVGITLVDTADLESIQLVGPDGTQSTVMSGGIQPGTKITVRGNSTVYSYLENNSVTVPAEGGGYTIIKAPEEVTSTQLSLQRADLSGTDYTLRTAYLACLYEPHEGFELGGEPVPANVSVPCHSPVLAQADSVQPGTSTGQDSDTITTPILLKEGEYRLLGTIGDEEGVVQTVGVDEETAGQ